MSEALLKNDDVTTQLARSVVRIGSAVNSCLLAQADTLTHCQNVVGTRLADVSTGVVGTVGKLTNGTVVLLDGSASAGNPIYLSASVAGRGTNTPPSIQVLLGYAYDVQLISGNYYASLVTPAVLQFTWLKRTFWNTAQVVTHTFNASARVAMLEAVGGGAAGGGAVSGAVGQTAVGGGGGGAAYFNVVVTLGPVRTCNIVIGAGGVGVSGADGNDGSPSTMTYDGTTYQANNGTHGRVGTPDNTLGLTIHGDRGLGGAYQFAIDGGAGQSGIRLDGSVAQSGAGGTTQWSGMIGSLLADGDGVPARTGGGGGCGAVATSLGNRKGGDGAPGLAIVTEFSYKLTPRPGT